MATTGLRFTRTKLITHLEASKGDITKRYDAKLRTAEAVQAKRKRLTAASEEARRRHLIGELRRRVKALEGGKADLNMREFVEPSGMPPRPAFPVTDSRDWELRNIDRAIRALKLSDQEAITLGSSLMRDLGIGRYL